MRRKLFLPLLILLLLQTASFAQESSWVSKVSKIFDLGKVKKVLNSLNNQEFVGASRLSNSANLVYPVDDVITSPYFGVISKNAAKTKVLEVNIFDSEEEKKIFSWKGDASFLELPKLKKGDYLIKVKSKEFEGEKEIIIKSEEEFSVIENAKVREKISKYKKKFDSENLSSCGRLLAWAVAFSTDPILKEFTYNRELIFGLYRLRCSKPE